MNQLFLARPMAATKKWGRFVTCRNLLARGRLQTCPTKMRAGRANFERLQRRACLYYLCALRSFALFLSYRVLVAAKGRAKSVASLR